MGEASIQHAHFNAYQVAFLRLQQLIDANGIQLQASDASMPGFESVDVEHQIQMSEEKILIPGNTGARLFFSHPAAHSASRFPGLALGAYPLTRDHPSSWIWHTEVSFGAIDSARVPIWRITQCFDERALSVHRPDFGSDKQALMDLTEGRALIAASELIIFFYNTL